MSHCALDSELVSQLSAIFQQRMMYPLLLSELPQLICGNKEIELQSCCYIKHCNEVKAEITCVAINQNEEARKTKVSSSARGCKYGCVLLQ